MNPCRSLGRHETRRLSQRRAIAACLAILCIGFAEFAAAADLRMRVDRRTMAANETLNLEIVYDERVATDVLDFESLLSDFQVVGSVRPRSETRIEDFKRSSRTSWQVTLLPKRIGVLEIPAIQIESARAPAIQIRVEEAPDSPELGAPLSAKLIPDKRIAFVDEQILLRVQLSAAQDVGGLRGSTLEISGADVTLVEQREYQRVIGQDPYQITELVYAIFAKSPGKIVLPSLEYSGRMRRGRTLVARTPPVEIEIQDPAQDPSASVKTPWLPASGLAVASEWSQPVDSLRVGEPVTRTLRVASASQHAAAIAPLELAPDFFKVYREQPVLNDTETSTGVLGTRLDAFVLVPTEAGTRTLPPVEIDWWNISEKKWERARIPAETVVVQAAASTGAPSTSSKPLSPLAIREQSNDRAEQEAAVSPPRENSPLTLFGLELQHERLSLLLTSLVSLCITLAIACVLLALRVRSLSRMRPSNEDPTRLSSLASTDSAAMKQVLRAIAMRDAPSFRSALLSWAQIHFGTDELNGLEEIGRRLGDSHLTGLLSALDASLYSRPRGAENEFSEWGALKDRLTNVSAGVSASRDTVSSQLPPLYPPRSTERS